jgi:hypothetical protein
MAKREAQKSKGTNILGRREYLLLSGGACVSLYTLCASYKKKGYEKGVEDPPICTRFEYWIGKWHLHLECNAPIQT